MLYLYIVMTPFMVFILVIRSAFGLKILGAYIMMAAWINSWLPLDTAIAHDMQQQLADNMYKAVMALIASGNPGMVMSPVFTNNMFDSLQQMILTGSSLMAYIPTLIFFLLGGSAYAFAADCQPCQPGWPECHSGRFGGTEAGDQPGYRNIRDDSAVE